MQHTIGLLFLYSQLYEISESLLYETQNIIVKILVLILNLNLMHETHHCPRWLLQISMSDLGDFSPKILFFGGHISLYRTILLIQYEIWQYTTKTLFIKNYRNLTVNRISLSSDLLINNWLSDSGVREDTAIFLPCGWHREQMHNTWPQRHLHSPLVRLIISLICAIVG